MYRMKKYFSYLKKKRSKKFGGIKIMRTFASAFEKTDVYGMHNQAIFERRQA
jgi:hypothetical protein